jgi:outer membrane protein assembly factor BamB
MGAGGGAVDRRRRRGRRDRGGRRAGDRRLECQGGGSQSPWIRRYSAAGDERWTAIVNVNQGTGQAIARLEDGSFVLSGHGTDGEAPWVQRVAGGGVALAAGLVNGEGLALLAAADRVFLAGSHRGEPRRALVAAFSSDLEPLWSTRDLEGVAVTLAYVDGDLIVAGSAVDGFSNRRISPGWIRRISGVDGALIWHHELDAGVGQQINDLAVDHQGAIVAVGEVSSPRLTAWMTKLDGDGEVIWEVVDPLDDVQPVPGDGRALAVAVDEDDRIFVAGRALDDLGYARLWVQEREP